MEVLIHYLGMLVFFTLKTAIFLHTDRVKVYLLSLNACKGYGQAFYNLSLNLRLQGPITNQQVAAVNCDGKDSHDLAAFHKLMLWILLASVVVDALSKMT